VKTLYILSDSTGTGQYVTLHKTWAHLLSEYLEGRYIVQNVSRNGETTRQALERLVPDVLRYKPDVIYIQYGSNDANKWDTDNGMRRLFLDEIASNLRSMIFRCHHFGCLVILGNNHTCAYNDVISNMISYDYFVDHSAYDGNITMEDGIHLNERGHRLYFENIARVIP